MRTRWAVLIACLVLAACLSPSREAARGRVARAEAEQWLATLGYQDDDRDFDRRLAALRLGVHRQAWALSSLIDALHHDRDAKVRAACAYAVGRIGGSPAVDALTKAAADPAREVRLAAATALAGQTDARAIEVLAEIGAQADGDLALAALRALDQGGGFDPRVVEARKQTPPNEPAPASPPVYVDPLGGDDGRDGTLRAPVRTIRQGLTLLKPGGTLYVAGLPNQPIREAVTVPASLSGFPQRPTRLTAWPGKPRPLLSPTRSVPSSALTRGADGRWRLKVDFAVLGVFQARSVDEADIYPLVQTPAELKPQTSWYDAKTGELVIDAGDDKLAPQLELAFAEDALAVAGANDVVVEGFDVRFAPDSGFDAAAATRVSFIDCRASFCDRHGIFFYYAPSGLVRNARVLGCSYQGLSVRSSPQMAVIGVEARGNGVDGILFLYDSDDGLVIDSRATGNYRGVSFIEGSDYGRVLGGDYAGNKHAGVSFESLSVGGQVIPPP
jgi:hypothetical protein